MNWFRKELGSPYLRFVQKKIFTRNSLNEKSVPSIRIFKWAVYLRWRKSSNFDTRDDNLSNHSSIPPINIIKIQLLCFMEITPINVDGVIKIYLLNNIQFNENIYKYIYEFISMKIFRFRCPSFHKIKGIYLELKLESFLLEVLKE